MPYYATSQEWLHQSSLLIEARPTTTRITTTYHISKPKPRKSKKSSTTSEPTESTTPAQPTPAAAAAAPRGSLTLKTYDPHSGVCLKYRTTKAAEVSRLILSLGRPLGARMAALPLPEAADEVMVDTPGEERKAEEVAPAAAAAASGSGSGSGGKGGQAQGQGQAQQQGGGAGGGGGGGKGKKKRGKK
ncbi:signal recognition particle 9 kDa protein-domain-containing protein [Hypoxylon sp. FL1857]|nr:signal recognition particle 9 kDa protein-domain-containing protein [Hypoxylon sp. FL1857]